MTENLEKQLYLIDPVFFEEAIACLNGKMNEMNTCMAFGCECGDGWFEPLKKLAQKTAIINNKAKLYNVKFICCQLKEKFGTLRIYWDLKTINADKIRKEIPAVNILTDMIVDAIHSCVTETGNTCEFCGYQPHAGIDSNPLGATSGWVHFICAKCDREKYKDNNEITNFSNGYYFLNPFNNISVWYNEKYYYNIFHAYIMNNNFDLSPKWIQTLIKENQKNSKVLYLFIKEFFNTDWNLSLLKDIVKSWFNEDTKQLLIETQNKEILWMNNLCDNILGICTCEACKNNNKAFNIWGHILMEIREEFCEDISERW